MNKEVTFHYGALCDSLEDQANAQGFTLGKDAERLESIKDAMLLCWIHGLVIDSQKDGMMKKMQAMVVKALKPLEKEQNDFYSHGKRKGVQE